MILNGHLLPGEKFETYNIKWWDVRDQGFKAKRLTRFDRRDRRGRPYFRGRHADQSWAMARLLGRVRIVRTFA